MRSVFRRVLGRRHGQAPGPGTSDGADASAILPTAVLERRWRRWLRGVARWLPRIAGGVVVFVLASWILLPTEIIAWRLGHEARKRGYDIEIEDVSIRPWGAIVLENVSWTFKPSRPGQIPDTLRIETAELDISVLRALVGTTDVTFEMDLGGGRAWVHWNDGGDEARFEAELADVPLGALPKAHQLLNAPLGGTVGLEVDLRVPEKKFARTKGTVTLACRGCSIGDGETLLYVPGAKGMLAKGVTIPEIDLGTLEGSFVFDKGVGRTEGPIVAKSDDVELTLDGIVTLRDPFSKSRLEMILKMQISEALQQRDERVRLLVQTMPETQRLKPPESGFGFKLYGRITRPRLRGIYSKTREERLRERRERARRRAEKRAARKRKAKAKKKRKPDTDREKEATNEEEREGREPAAARLDIRPLEPESTGAVGKPVQLDPASGAEGAEAGGSGGNAPADGNAEGGEGQGEGVGAEQGGSSGGQPEGQATGSAEETVIQ
ncbi:MAG: type II secretion system protein GspN [Deltaproteobacteria bacterium]|nr:MAG: type II secretion system protein GspN [Deltaproteobacteria bacterium]